MEGREITETLDPVLPHDVRQRAAEILAIACEREAPIATAESCTGGLLAALRSDIPGCSRMFERGFVVYSNPAKCDLLGRDLAEVEDCGAVSREVAIAIAEGALRRRGGAGDRGHRLCRPPPSSENGEEGLVHFACARKDGPSRVAFRRDRARRRARRGAACLARGDEQGVRVRLGGSG